MKCHNLKPGSRRRNRKCKAAQMLHNKEICTLRPGWMADHHLFYATISSHGLWPLRVWGAQSQCGWPLGLSYGGQEWEYPSSALCPLCHVYWLLCGWLCAPCCVHRALPRHSWGFAAGIYLQHLNDIFNKSCQGAGLLFIRRHLMALLIQSRFP